MWRACGRCSPRRSRNWPNARNNRPPKVRRALIRRFVVRRLNSSLARSNSEIVTRLETARREIAEANALQVRWSSQISETRRQAEAGSFSYGIGLLLRSELSELPDTTQLRERSRKRVQEIPKLSLEALKWEHSRRKLVDIDAAIEAELSELGADSPAGVESRDSIVAELRAFLENRRQLYAELVENSRSLFGQLTRLEALEENFANAIESHESFIREHVLWIPSAPPASASLLADAATGAAQLFNRKSLVAAAKRCWADVQDYPLKTAPLLLVAGWIFLMGRRLTKKLAECGTVAQRASTTSFRATLVALVATTLLSLPLAIVVLAFGWRLRSNSPLDGLEHALGQTVLMISYALATTSFGQRLCRSKGLGESHFEWPEQTLRTLSAIAFRSIWLVLPFASVVYLTELLQDELLIASLGRFAFYVTLVGVGVLASRFTCPQGLRALIMHSDGMWASLRKQWMLVGMLLLLSSLGVISASGYHYAAIHLSQQLLTSGLIVGMLVLLKSLVMRWLLLSYRRTAIQRSRERRESLAKSRELASEVGGRGKRD